MSSEIYNTHRWRELVKILCPPGSLCEIEECAAPSREILFGLRPRHSLGPSLDHIVELQFGGDEYDPANLRPSHLGCNVRKSNKLRRLAREALAQAPARVGRTKAALLAPSRVKRSSEVLDRPHRTE